MSTWAQQAANRLRATQVEVDSALEEHKLRKALAPRFWSRLREWIRTSCKELNANTGREILVFEVRPQNEATVVRLKGEKPIKRLRVKFDQESCTIEYTCGSERGEYAFGVNLSSSSTYLLDSNFDSSSASEAVPLTVEEFGSFLLDKLTA